MSHKAGVVEERAIEHDEVLTAESLIAQFPMVKVKVVYMGSHPNKTQRMKGQILMETVEPDESLPAHERARAIQHVNKRMVAEGYTMYDFAKLDSRSRPRKDRMTDDGHRFEPCEHLGHALAFYRMKDEDGQPIYQIRGEPAALSVLKRYRDVMGGRINSGIPHADSGEGVLKDMKDVLPD